jgi:hypothetical protein
VKSNPNGYSSVVQAESQSDKKERGKAFRQIVAAFIANIGPMNTGLIFGFSAVVIPKLQAATSEIPIDESQSSWIGMYRNLIEHNCQFKSGRINLWRLEVVY